jgi:hypothetical protein
MRMGTITSLQPERFSSEEERVCPHRDDEEKRPTKCTLSFQAKPFSSAGRLNGKTLFQRRTLGLQMSNTVSPPDLSHLQSNYNYNHNSIPRKIL